jgi:hypothetical protein
MAVYVKQSGKWEALGMPTRKEPPTPSFWDLIFRFGKATAQWAEAGFPIVSREVFQDRLRSCQGCQWWKGWRCAQCGCAGVKLWLATEQCPLPEPERRWGAVRLQADSS